MNPSTRTILLSALSSTFVSLVVVSTALGTNALFAPSSAQESSSQRNALTLPTLNDAREQTLIQTVDAAEPAVVSVIISKDLPVLDRSRRGETTGDPFLDRLLGLNGQSTQTPQGTRRLEIGGGTAFFVTSDGLLMTNRHVVDDPNAQYTVLLNDGRRLEATVVGRDPANDVALLKVEGNDFPFVKLSDQESPSLGQTVIAIGNALGEFRNTVSVGVISGLQRNIMAGNPAAGDYERLSRIIQTDAAINEGNSGGPLLASDGTVIGMSTAVAAGAQNIGFAIPAPDLRRALTSYQKYGRIVRPYIGIRYTSITPELAQELDLNQTDGALILAGDTGEAAIMPGSPAADAGLRDKDIILSIDGQDLTEELSIADVLAGKLPGDKVHMRVVRDGKQLDIPVLLEEWKDE